MTGLCLDRVSVVAGKSEILKAVSFSVAPGEIVGLIGPNGAGKSTAIRAALGLAKTSNGTVTVGGEPVAHMSGRDRARKLAYVPQGAPVHWPLTAERTVALGRIPHLHPWQELADADIEAVENAMRLTDSWGFRGRLITTLSGGERARVLLARTIAVGSQYLLADEPTASLDPEHQLQVMEIMQSQAKAGVGVVIVMHDLSLAMRTCHKLVLLNKGEILAKGTPDTVLTDENVAKAFNVKVARWSDGDSHYMTPHTSLGG
ncbi:MAG: ABC transporter ATP-binding protein [Kordiimonadaceae bacterium]|nr:ABC transporter ATP-binding protein [Kordiimonadaceae bacterium]